MAKTIKNKKNHQSLGGILNQNVYFNKHPAIFSLLVIGGIVFITLDKTEGIIFKGLALVGLLVLILGFRKVICPSCRIKDAVVWNQIKKCPKCGRELTNYGLFSRIWGLDK